MRASGIGGGVPVVEIFHEKLFCFCRGVGILTAYVCVNMLLLYFSNWKSGELALRGDSTGGAEVAAVTIAAPPPALS